MLTSELSNFQNELYKILEYTSVVYKDTDIILKHAKKYERS